MTKQHASSLAPRWILLHAPVGGGHRSAAEALAASATASGISVEALDAFSFAPKAFAEFYRALHFAGQGLAPQLYGRAYFRANQRSPFDDVRSDVDLALFRPLIAHLKTKKPDLVVATHHLALIAVARARSRGELTCEIACVVTDYTAHAVWAVPQVDRYFVANAMVAEELIAHGVPASRVSCTGIPVQRGFAALPSLAPLASPTEDAPLRVLLTSGGFGVGPIEQVLRGFVDVPAMAVTVVCGASDTLRARVSHLVRSLRLRANVLGFERNMPARMAEADVVVGKAGGLTVTEALTAGRPLVIVGAVPGNEQLNETWVTMGGAGVSATPALAAATIFSVRGELARMGVRGRAMVAKDAAGNIVQELRRGFVTPGARVAA